MISKETIKEALDVVEAVCLISNLYKEKGIKDRATSAYISGGVYPALRLVIGNYTDDNGKFIASENFEVLLDDEHDFGSTFEQVTAAILKEVERVENG